MNVHITVQQMNQRVLCKCKAIEIFQPIFFGCLLPMVEKSVQHFGVWHYYLRSHLAPDPPTVVTTRTTSFVLLKKMINQAWIAAENIADPCIC